MILAELEKRGFVHSITDREGFDSPLTFYCGFDPTAESLHAGTLLPIFLMRRLAQAGYKPIALVGTATGMIGDPSGKSQERNLLSRELIEKNAQGITAQLKHYIGNEVEVVYNHTWLEKLSFIDFLRDVGKFVSVNAMIAKDSVSTRLKEREQGISYTEFSYMLLQAYDFHWLYQEKGCRLQVGGSDQWGNITTGIQLIRRFDESAKVFGLTSPLLTTSSGAKFGKTEQGAIWLSPERTSPYAFYQYWLNTQDADVIRYLKLFTELSDHEILELERETQSAPEKRLAQKALADSVTGFIHGTEAVKSAEQASAVLFGGSLDGLGAETLLDIFSEVPSTTISEDAIGLPVGELWVQTQLAGSKSAARRLIEGGGCYLNNQRIDSFNKALKKDDFIEGSVVVLRSGKKKYHLVKLSS